MKLKLKQTSKQKCVPIKILIPPKKQDLRLRLQTIL